MRLLFFLFVRLRKAALPPSMKSFLDQFGASVDIFSSYCISSGMAGLTKSLLSVDKAILGEEALGARAAAAATAAAARTADRWNPLLFSGRVRGGLRLCRLCGCGGCCCWGLEYGCSRWGLEYGRTSWGLWLCRPCWGLEYGRPCRGLRLSRSCCCACCCWYSCCRYCCRWYSRNASSAAISHSCFFASSCVCCRVCCCDCGW